MKKFILGFVFISMLNGCSQTEEQASNLTGENRTGVAPATVADNPEKTASIPVAELNTAAELPTDSNAKTETDATETVAKSTEPRINATTLLASTPANAKSQNKRVLVHLSADR